MTTDPFTEAASVAANERFGTAGNREVWMEAAEWARTHLAAQEPTDAEVDEIAEQLDYEDDPWDRTDPDVTWGLPGNERAEAYRDLVRRVLAARAARRDEEKRNG